MLLYTKRRNVQCFTLSLPQHVHVLSAVLFSRSRPAMPTNGYKSNLGFMTKIFGKIFRP